MTIHECPNEEKIRQAAASKRWDPDLLAHIETCPACADIVLVASFFDAEAAGAAAEVHLPDAGLIWWKAQLQARRMAAEKSTRPIVLFQKGALALSLLSVVVVLAVFWPRLEQCLTFLRENQTTLRLISGFGGAGLFLIAGVTLGILLVSAACALAIWAER